MGRRSQAQILADQAVEERIVPEPVVVPEFVNTPEFQAAVQAAAQEVVKHTIGKIAEQGAPIGTGSDPQATQLFSQMAMAIAEISDQGSGRKRIAPEILAAREAAHARAENLLDKARDKGLRATYRVVSKIYLNDRFIEPFRRLNDKTVVPNEIEWTGMPNEGMEPINDVAKEIFAAYRESIGRKELTPNADRRPVFVTKNGLVVKGDAPQRQTLGTEMPAFRESVNLTGEESRPHVGRPDDPTAPFVRVLGSVAEPAKQNVAGQDHYAGAA